MRTVGPSSKPGAQVQASDPANSVASPLKAIVFAPDRAELRALTALTAVLCYSAVRTFAVMPDREHAWLYRLGSGTPAYIASQENIWRDFGADVWTEIERLRTEEAKERRARYEPTRAELTRCLDVLGWISWMGREGNRKAERKIICARAYRVSYRSIGERLGRHEDTVKRWEDAAFRAIVGEYHVAIEALG